MADDGSTPPPGADGSNSPGYWGPPPTVDPTQAGPPSYQSPSYESPAYQPPSYQSPPSEPTPSQPPPYPWSGPEAAPPYGFGAQPPPYPPGPGYGPAQPQYLPGPYPVYPAPQSNGVAIAALICGLLGFFCVTLFAAIGLGIGGLQQSKRTGVGRVMSIWAICLGAAWLVLFAGFIAIAVANSSN